MDLEFPHLSVPDHNALEALGMHPGRAGGLAKIWLEQINWQAGWLFGASAASPIEPTHTFLRCSQVPPVMCSSDRVQVEKDMCTKPGYPKEAWRPGMTFW